MVPLTNHDISEHDVDGDIHEHDDGEGRLQSSCLCINNLCSGDDEPPLQPPFR